MNSRCIAGARFLQGAFCQTWHLNLGGEGLKINVFQRWRPCAMREPFFADAFCWKKMPCGAVYGYGPILIPRYRFNIVPYIKNLCLFVGFAVVQWECVCFCFIMVVSSAS